MRTCIHCGRDQEDDNDIQREVIEELNGVVAVPTETLRCLRQEIETLNTIVVDNNLHTPRTEALMEHTYKILDILLE